MEEALEFALWLVIVLVVGVYKAANRKKREESGASGSIVGTLLSAGRANTDPTGRVEPPTPPVTPPPAAKYDDRERGESHYFSAGETGEGHVASVGLSRERQLEQLEVLRSAGLLDEDEYKQRKRKIRED